MEVRCEINRFIQAVAVSTPCSSKLPSSFLKLSSYFGSASISVIPLLSFKSAFSYTDSAPPSCLLPSPFIQNVICLHFAVLSDEMLSICPN